MSPMPADPFLNSFVPDCSATGAERAFLYRSGAFRARFTGAGITWENSQGEIRTSYLDSHLNAGPVEAQLQPGVVQFIQAGVPETCRSRSMYAALSYPELYDGISAHFEAASGKVKSEYRLQPGADPGQIRIRHAGAAGQSVSKTGDLELFLNTGLWREQRPEAWQMEAGQKRAVEVSWRLNEDGSAGFVVGEYNPALELIIDPVVSFSTYLTNTTSASISAATSTAVDLQGNILMAGWLEGSNLGVGSNTQATNGGSVDAFLIKTNPSGTILFATYFGGSGDDRALGVTVDPSGNPWITGSTSSSDLPTKNAFQSTLPGYRNIFVAKFAPYGGLLFSTYLGGVGPDSGNSITADLSGNVYIAGDTQSINLPVRQAAQPSYGGGQDAFAAKLNASGALVYLTYLGGSANDHGAGIAVDSAGSVYITGGTSSLNFPTRGPLQANLKGSADAFVTKFDANGALVYSTYLGGAGGTWMLQEQGSAIAVDSVGQAYVAGVTSSTDFPVTSGAAQTTFTGQADAFLVKLDPSGSVIVFSSLAGASGLTVPSAIALDHYGAACLAGYTSSFDFPLMAPFQAQNNGLYDAFITVFTPSGNGFYFSSLLGGSGIDAANGVSIDSSGNIYVVGQTGSLDYPLTNAMPRTRSGGLAAFSAKIITDDSANFVIRTYFGVFERTPDAATLTYWTNQLNQGATTRLQAALGFFQDPGYQAAAFNVAAAYIAVLGRQPEYGGFEYWVNVFRGGSLAYTGCSTVTSANATACSQLALLNVFAGSPEFATRFGAPDSTGFVTLLYQNVLGRAPDQGGLDFWVKVLNGGSTRSQMVQNFINSPEFHDRFGNRIQVELAYFAFLMRDADSAGLQAWINALNSGTQVSDMVNAFLQSQEFKSGL